MNLDRAVMAFAGVMILEPRWLVLDEPTTLLDRKNTRTIMAAIEALDQHVVLVTHDLSLLEAFERVLVFEAGRIVADAAPGEAIDAYLRLTG